jgi:hypothetical protein
MYYSSFQGQKPDLSSYHRNHDNGNLFVEGKINGKLYEWKQKKKQVRFQPRHYTMKNTIKWKTPHPKKKQKKTKRLNRHINVPRYTI